MRLLAPFLLLLLGCAPRVTDDAKSDAALETSSGWVVFGSRAEAATWWRENGSWRLYADGDPQTLRVQRIIDAHWQTVRARYPLAISPPVALVVDSPAENAYAPNDGQSGKAVNAIVVMAGTLRRDDEQVDAILAHELGHIVGRHAEPDRAAAVVRYYRATAPEPLGILQVDEPALHDRVAEIRNAGLLAGPAAFPELEGVPYTGRYNQMLWFLMGDGQSDACATVRDDLARLQSILAKAPGELWESERARVASVVHEIQTSTCFAAADGVSLIDALASRLGIDHAAAARYVADEDRDVAESSTNASAGLFAITKRARSRLIALESTPEYMALRWYTAEEEADDFGMTIRHLEGKDPLENARFTVAAEGAESQAKCEATLARGEVPFYWFDDAHHAGCYRLFHARAFSNWLERGGEGVTPAQIMGTTRAPGAPQEELGVRDRGVRGEVETDGAGVTARVREHSRPSRVHS